MKKNILFFITLNILSCTACSASSSKQPRRKEIKDELRLIHNPENTHPSFSAEDIKTIASVQQFQEQLEQTEMTEKAIANLHERLKHERTAGWDTLTPEDEVPSTKPMPPAPTFLTMLQKIPLDFWEKHVTNPNRIEYVLHFSGVKTYIILLQKLKENGFHPFIQDLNTNNAGEGNRWIDEALNQAIKDKREDIVRKIILAARAYKEALPKTTLLNVVYFLNHCADKKRKALAADNEDYASDIHQLARIIQQADPDNLESLEIPKEYLEQSAHQAALTLTQSATAGYLPKIITDNNLPLF